MEKVSLRLHAYDWREVNGPTAQEPTEIQAWCFDEESKPHLIRFNNFPVLANLELPSFINGREIQWNRKQVERIYVYLQNAARLNAPINKVHYTAKKLYYVQYEPTNFLMLQFTSKMALRACKELLDKPRRIFGLFGQTESYVKLNLHETQINLVRKLLTERKCKYSDWFDIEANRVNPERKISVDTVEEYFGIWNSMHHVELNKITTPNIMVIDIEVMSANPRAFPNPWNSRDIAYMISCVYQGRDVRRNICIIYGIANDPREGYEYIYVNTEAELLEKFKAIVHELDPDILTGYNIHGFDYIYLDRRLKRLGMTWGSLGRIKNEETKISNVNWNSSGFGQNDLYILQMPGRISVDMMTVVKREHKLRKYNLDFAANYFGLSEGKDPVSAQQMFKVVRHLKLLEDLVTHLNSDSTMSDYDEFNLIYYMRDRDKLVKWIYERSADKLDSKLVAKAIELVDYVREEMRIIADYCIKDSILVLQLFEKLSTWISMIQNSSITGVTPTDLWNRGQQARGLSIIYDLAKRKNIVLDTQVFPEKKYTGGFVGDPIPGVYENVICLDFKSLYPNIMRTFNICFTTYVPHYMDAYVPDNLCHVIEWIDEVLIEETIKLYDQNREEIVERDGKRYRKIDGVPIDDSAILYNQNGEEIVEKDGKRYHKSKHRERFLKEEYCKGILPELLGDLIDERNKIRKAQKGLSRDSIEWMILEQKQLAMKQTANSIYGLLGVGKKGVLPLPAAAAAVTAYGRQWILYCNKTIEERYGGKVVYNDTDSTMIILPYVKTGQDALEWGGKLQKELSDEMPGNLFLEFEKAGIMFAIAKKNYVFWILMQNGLLPYKNGRPNFVAKGIAPARRDKSKWQCDIVADALDMIILHKNSQEFLDMIIENIVRTLRGQIEWDRFSIVKGLGSKYKNPNYPMKIFAEELQRIGRPVQPGDRIEYVIVDNQDAKSLLGMKMRDIDTYLERVGTKDHEPIDYKYYIEHFLMECIENYWRIAYRDVVDKSELQNQLDDANAILVELRLTGYEDCVSVALARNRYDPRLALAALKSVKQLENVITKARRKHNTGRHVFKMRINAQPIRLLIKAFDRGLLNEAVKCLASSELCSKLY